MTTEQPPAPPKAKHWLAPNERVALQLIHWGVVLVVVVIVGILALRGDLDHASVTALYGTVLGHAGTSASQKLSSRSTDRTNGS